MDPQTRPVRAPAGITTLDLLLFTAGFACGWVMHQGSALRTFRFYILPLSRGPFQSILGMTWTGWLWAFAVGVAFLIIGRRFRYDCRSAPPIGSPSPSPSFYWNRSFPPFEPSVSDR